MANKVSGSEIAKSSWICSFGFFAGHEFVAKVILQNSRVCRGKSITWPGKGEVVMRENETECLIPPGRGGIWDLESQEGFTRQAWSVGPGF